MSTSPTIPVAVLMVTYCKDNHAHLAEAIQSVLNQTALPVRFLIVANGPLTPQQEHVLQKPLEQDRLQILRLPHNEGLAGALQKGLELCTEEFIARMDSDDVCAPDRLRIQYGYLSDTIEVGIVCSIQPEFSETWQKIDRVKCTPLSHQEIAAQLVWRNVISHPSVMFRKSAIVRAGGYRDIYLLEDYDLWLRCLAKGLRFACIQKPLLYMRVMPAQRGRRGGWKYAVENVKWRMRMRREGIYSIWQFLLLTPLYFLFHITPRFVKAFLYKVSGVRKSMRHTDGV